MTLVFYAVSQIERLMHYVGEADGATAMNFFFALVVIGGGFVMFAIRSKAYYVLKKQLARFEESVNAQLYAQHAELDTRLETMATGAQVNAAAEATKDATRNQVNAAAEEMREAMRAQTKALRKLISQNAGTGGGNDE